MYQNNNSYNGQESLQNRFTAFVVLSLRRKKITYINCQCRKKDNLYSLDDGFLDYMPDNSDFVEEVCDEELVRRIMLILTPKERYIIISRVLYGNEFGEIANKLNLKYKTVSSIYYRAIEKLRNMFEGES